MQTGTTKLHQQTGFQWSVSVFIPAPLELSLVDVLRISGAVALTDVASLSGELSRTTTFEVIQMRNALTVVETRIAIEKARRSVVQWDDMGGRCRPRYVNQPTRLVELCTVPCSHSERTLCTLPFTSISLFFFIYCTKLSPLLRKSVGEGLELVNCIFSCLLIQIKKHSTVP